MRMKRRTGHNQVPISNMGTSATTCWPHQREHPRATTTATYVYQAPSWSINENTTIQSSSRERRSTTTLGREETRLAGLGIPPVSQTPVYEAPAMAGLHIEPSRFRPRPGLVPPPVSSHVKNPQTITTNGARRRTQTPVDRNQERNRGRLDEEYIPRGEGLVRVASNIEYRNTLSSYWIIMGRQNKTLTPAQSSP